MSEEQPVHVVPEQSSDGPMHALNDEADCPCRPLTQFVSPADGCGPKEWRIVHRTLPLGDPPAGLSAADDARVLRVTRLAGGSGD